jgi:hypothetical protein
MQFLQVRRNRRRTMRQQILYVSFFTIICNISGFYCLHAGAMATLYFAILSNVYTTCSEIKVKIMAIPHNT